ncbi:hypothetical protein KUH32_16530 [Thalassococcus sp. CAU 1522]|uniref:Pentapeptide repeat-containing protein n=1 Tax=Thalassococcus arenae TaxID=2851652 RepID=A0ABS6NBJ7_9RHOB|nr:hypothetical protein [Thalassococcus arenae]MBV2361373.1 hypothetical protein [Thalassococcus arenae]
MTDIPDTPEATVNAVPAVLRGTDDGGAITSETVRAAILAAHVAHLNDIAYPRAFRVENARISGMLALDGLFPEGGQSLIALDFRNCTFEEGIDISRSCLSRMTFTDCRLRRIEAEHCRVSGAVALEGVCSSEPPGRGTGQVHLDDWHGGRGPMADRAAETAPLSEPWTRNAVVSRAKRAQGLCLLNFNGARIEGSFVLKRTLVVGDEPRKGLDVSNTVLKFALQLSNTRIAGSVQIIERSAVLGGINLANARIGGDLYLAGCLVIGGEGTAIRGQTCCIDGFLALRNRNTPGQPRERFEAYGGVDLMGAKIGSACDLSGGYFSAEAPDRFALAFFGTDMENLVCNRDTNDPPVVTEIIGPFSLRNSHIREDLTLDGTIVRPVRTAALKTAADQANTAVLLDLSQARVDGSLALYADIAGQCSLSDAEVGKTLTLGHAHPSQFLRLRVPPTNHVALSLENLRCGNRLAVGKIAIDCQTGTEKLHALLAAKTAPKARILALPFAPGAELIEFAGPIDGETHFAYAIRTSKGVQLLDGTGPTVIAPLMAHGLSLDSAADKLAFIRMFCATVLGPAGPFRIIEPGDWACQQLPRPAAELVRPLRLLPPGESEGNRAMVLATIWYANAIFEAKIAMPGNSLILKMTEDKPLFEGLPMLTWSHAPLFFALPGGPRFSDEWPLPPVLPDQPASEGALDKVTLKRLRRAMPKRDRVFAVRPTISLTNAHARELSDSDGNAWPKEARLDLSGFTYDALTVVTRRDTQVADRQKRHAARLKRRVAALQGAHSGTGSTGFWERLGQALAIAFALGVLWLTWKGVQTAASMTGWWPVLAAIAALIAFAAIKKHRSVRSSDARTTYQRRRRWLRLQYDGYNPTRAEFNPQPFEQLARVLRHQGQEEEYRRVSRLRARWQHSTVTAPIWRPFMLLYSLCFGYGYSLQRGAVTFVALLVLGYVGTQTALQRDILVLNTTPDTATISGTASRMIDIPCRGQAVPLLFALDKLVPLIELGQESQCRVRADESGLPPFPAMPEPATRMAGFLPYGPSLNESAGRLIVWTDEALDVPALWHVATAVYKLFGWIVGSLLILTFSRIFRRSTGE